MSIKDKVQARFLDQNTPKNMVNVSFASANHYFKSNVPINDFRTNKTFGDLYFNIFFHVCVVQLTMLTLCLVLIL